ncbi:MAG: hypothetical protein K9H26_06615 [Prolixibacteraceae bacterium]|nr:hypothetical protein [Prolixibacteraceae bacterium]
MEFVIDKVHENTGKKEIIPISTCNKGSSKHSGGTHYFYLEIFVAKQYGTKKSALLVLQSAQ